MDDFFVKFFAVEFLQHCSHFSFYSLGITLKGNIIDIRGDVGG